MKRSTFFNWVVAMALMIGLTMPSALAQFTDEAIFCTNGTSADTCRASIVEPDPDGVVRWYRSLYGDNVCFGAGFNPMQFTCSFVISSYFNLFCQPPILGIALAETEIGDEMAIVCDRLVPGPYPQLDLSFKYTGNSCFPGVSPCGRLSIFYFE